MNFDDLKDQLQESFNRLKSEIQENPAFNSLKEKYETLPTRAQKAIQALGALMVVYVLISIPMGAFEEAKYQEDQYETHKELIRKLLKTGKPDRRTSEISKQVSIDNVKSRVQSAVNSAGLMTEQVKSISTGGATKDSIAPKSITEETVVVTLDDLNLTQIVNIGHQIQQMIANVKMTGLELEESTKNPGYFNAKYILSKFNLPKVELAKSEDSKGKKDNKRSKRPSRGKRDPKSRRGK